jgi:hypothetical protein
MRNRSTSDRTTPRLEWPPPYKAATEKYASQVTLNDRGKVRELCCRTALSVA